MMAGVQYNPVNYTKPARRSPRETLQFLKVLVVLAHGVPNDKHTVGLIETDLAAAGMVFRSHDLFDVRIVGVIQANQAPPGITTNAGGKVQCNNVNPGLFVASLRGTTFSSNVYVVYIAEKINQGTSGFTVTGCLASVICLPKNRIGSGDGQTWAHEICHGLGEHHHAGNDNLMNASRHGGAGGGLTGHQLDNAQKKSISQVCNTHGLLVD